MKVILTGANGQLGKCLLDAFPKEWDINAFGSKDLNITDYNHTLCIINKIQPDVIINAAAYTKVDLAESDKYLANSVNATGIYNLAVAAKQNNAKLIHISTDYVFNGEKNSPYQENDVTEPLNVYGQSKLAGENLAFSTHANTLVVRTSWVFSEYSNNFLKTMLEIGKNNSQLRIVSDQIGTPTYAGDIAQAIIYILQSKPETRGLLNISGNDICSWAEFAGEIFKKANHLFTGYHIPEITPILTKDYPTAATRPLYSVLDTKKICTLGFTSESLDFNINHVIHKIKEA